MAGSPLRQNEHPQLCQPAEFGKRSPFERLISEAKVREALHEGSDSELCFQTRERRAEAEVRATAEGMMMRICACDIEPVGLGVRGRIAIRRSKRRQDRLAARCAHGHDAAAFVLTDHRGGLPPALPPEQDEGRRKHLTQAITTGDRPSRARDGLDPPELLHG
jgi:hypothetical protein